MVLLAINLFFSIDHFRKIKLIKCQNIIIQASHDLFNYYHRHHHLYRFLVTLSPTTFNFQASNVTTQWKAIPVGLALQDIQVMERGVNPLGAVPVTRVHKVNGMIGKSKLY